MYNRGLPLTNPTNHYIKEGMYFERKMSDLKNAGKLLTRYYTIRKFRGLSYEIPYKAH